MNAFDEVNVATALHRLAKLQPPNNSGGQASPVIYADHFQQLVIAIKRQLHRFEAQAISNTMWGELHTLLLLRTYVIAKGWAVCAAHCTEACIFVVEALVATSCLQLRPASAEVMSVQQMFSF